MRRTKSSLRLTLILVVSATSSLAAQNRSRLGDTWPTKDLTPAQRTFAESYLAAVTGSDIERYKRLLHPGTLACMNAENADFFKGIFKRRVGQVATQPALSVETLPAKFAMYDALTAQGWVYPARPTHAFHIDLVSTLDKDVSIIAFAVRDHGVWYEVLPCPSAKALAAMKHG